jgi:hypothetical protein
MYNPPPATPGSPYTPRDFEYVELVNTGTAAMDLTGVTFDKGVTYAFAPGATLAAGERVLIVANRNAFQSRYGTGLPLAAGAFTGSLSDGGERLRLLGRVGETVQDFTYSDGWYSQTDGQGYSLTIVDPAGPLDAWNTKQGWRASEGRFGTPGGTDNGLRPNSVVINEILTNPSGAGVDGADWVELRNTTGAAIDIGNWWLSDSAGNLKKWHIPAGTVVPANGYLVFTSAGTFGGAFDFDAAGEGVYLSSGDAAGNIGGYRVDETFGAADLGVTFGRFVKSTGGADFTAMASATRGAANSAPLVGPVVINEIMYFPPSGKSEYLELRNLTASDVSLYLAGNPAVTWRLTGGIDFALPSGATIPANGYAIISAVDPATFRQQYPQVPAGVPVWGPYTLADGVNVLSDNGESVRLQKPGIQSGANPRPYIDVDRVAYDDEAPWPADTKGTSQSLAKRNSSGFGNDPVNWDSERQNGSPGEANFAPDFTPPVADVVDVTPDPRTTTVDTITITFGERVTGFDPADLTLTRNGSATNLLTGAQTLTTTDNVTWTLRNLAPLTLFSGQYLLTVVAAGSGIQDTAHNVMAADASDAWVMNNPDIAGPTANITDVTPDPRGTPVNTISIVFSEIVTGFDLSDLTLTRNGGPNMLSASHTLTTADNGKTWVLGGLLNQTGVEGQYLLTLKPTGTGIADLAGNAIAGGATDAWAVDLTPATIDVVDVSPDPRRDGVDSVTIVFSETVSGFDRTDLRLTIDGGGNNLLTAAQTLTTSDGGRTYSLGNLGSLTGFTGTYRLTVVTTDAGITDRVGNVIPPSGTASDTWFVDGDAPTADVVDVEPDPRDGAVDTITILFSEPITGFDLADLQLSRDGAAGHVGNLLTAAQSLVSLDDGSSWELRNLSGITSGAGTYTLALVSGVAGISDLIGNSLASDAVDSWTVSAPPAATVVGRYTFYNASSFDGGSAAADALDDAAIATDKQARVGSAAGALANYTSYVRGLNGLMVDVAGLGGGVTLSADDFVFRVAGDLGAAAAGWADGPAPSLVNIRRGAGVGGSDRVTLCWPDGAIKNTWLQVTVKANADTGLAADDVFYFGNLVGETGDSATAARVNALDLAAVKRALGPVGMPVGNLMDFNRDGRVNALDLAAVKQNLGRTLGLAAAPAAPAVAPASVAVFSDDPVASPLKTTDVWFESQPDLLGRT